MQATAALSGRKLDWLIRFLLVGAVLIVFWPVLQGKFLLWDDPDNILNHPHLGLSWADLYWMFSDTSYAPRYMPLGWLTYATARALFGISAPGFHACNLVLHAVNTLLLFEILKHLLQFFFRKTSDTPSIWRWGAGAAALWWAVNPLRTESVGWASGLIYFVAAFFFFASVLLYLRAADLEITSRRRLVVRLAAASFAVSLLVYPIALGGLVLFFVLDILPLRRLPLSLRSWASSEFRAVWMEKLLFLLPACLVVVLNVVARALSADTQVAPSEPFGFAAHVMQALWVFSWYIWKPWLPFDLAPKYSDLLTNMPFTGSHLTAAALFAAITILALLRRRTWPWLLMIWITYLALMAPFTGVFHHPHHTYDRYSYIVGGLWAVVLAGGIGVFLRRRECRLPVAAMATILCSFLGWQSHQQTFIWKNSLNLHTWMAESLGSHSERVGHDMIVAQIYLAMERPSNANLVLRQALPLQPEMPGLWWTLGEVFAQQKRIDDAIGACQKALKLAETKAESARAFNLLLAREKLGIALAAAQRHEEAVEQFSYLLRRDPGSSALHQNLALSLWELGWIEEAEMHFEEACEIASRKGGYRAPGIPDTRRVSQPLD